MINPSSTIRLIEVGQAHAERGQDAGQRVQHDLAQAEHHYREAVTHDAEYALPRVRLGYVCFDRKEYENARRHFEDALAIEIPENANTIRNIMQLALQVHDHLVHFYHLHALDWVDVVSALSADPKATSALAQSLSSYPRSSEGYFRDVQKKVKDFVEAGQLVPLAGLVQIPDGDAQVVDTPELHESPPFSSRALRTLSGVIGSSLIHTPTAS